MDLPLLGGIKPYDRSWLSRDVVAGITLAALAIPEVMGYTKIAGMPVITGLYTMLLPVAAFALLGSSRHLVVGGDSATAAIMYGGIATLGVAGLKPGTPHWVALASMSALLAAAFLFVARVARLGFLANFISRTVLVGFLTGVGIQVALSQFAGLFGVPGPHVSAGRWSGTLIKFWDTLKELGQTSWSTFAISLAVIATLVVFERWIKVVPGGLVAVVGAIAASWIFDWSSHGIAILGPVPRGLPHVGVPHGVTWSQTAGLASTAASMFLVILAQSAATSRAYAVKHEEHFVENNDIVGLSAANLVAGLSGTFVVNGSPTKTEMVDEAKGRTQVAQLTTALVVIVVLLFLTKPLQYLPNAVLAAIVFVIGLKLVDVSNMRRIARLRRDEFWVALATTVVVVVVGVEQGIIVAIVLSLILHVRRHYEPIDTVTRHDGTVVYRFGVGIFFANAQRLADEVSAIVDSPQRPHRFVLNAEAIDDVDYTGGMTLLELGRQLAARHVEFAVACASTHLRAELDDFGVTALIGADHYYDTVDAAVAGHR